MTTPYINVIIAIFGLFLAGVAALIFRDSKGRVPGSGYWVCANLCFVGSMCSFMFPHNPIALFIGAMLTYAAFWVGVEGFFRFYRIEQRVLWALWIPVSLIVAFLDAGLAERNPPLRYLVFNGYFVLLLLWFLLWILTNRKKLGVVLGLRVLILPLLSVFLGTFRFLLSLCGQYNQFWFYGGPGEVSYRFTLLLVLGAVGLLELRLVSHRLVTIIDEAHQEHARAQRGILVTIAALADNSAEETPGHVLRVGHLAEILALAIGWEKTRAEELNEAARLHDLGKIAVRDAILEKADALTEEERLLMRQHTRLGSEILSHSNLPIYQIAARIAAEHHENWDGSGYPAGLGGEEISEESRIVAICDVIDALSRQRSYKAPWPEEEIKNFLLIEGGKKFDPRLVDAALRLSLWKL